MKYYITTPIYYVNDAPHIGHAYTSVMADITARKLRNRGNEVFYLTGTDEHGQKIERSAKAKGIEPLVFCDEVSHKFVDLMKDFNISNNDFIRTTEERHKNGVKAFWNKLQQNGWIYKGKYAGWYAVRDEAFYTEEELINGKAPTGAEVEWQEEETYLFRLSLFEEILLEVYDKIPSVVFPLSRLNEVKSFVKMGLNDLSISRTSFKWGIPVPNDEKHVIYVWLDALTNYITALGYGSNDTSKYEKFWTDKEAIKMHYIGKDILRFHAIFWPAFLIAEKYKIGEINNTEVLEFFKNFQVISHGWWKNNGEKMSKSLGNAISTEYLKELGVDKVRYYFERSMPFGGDGDFSLESFKELTNADLANNIGNLSQRVMTFIYTNCEGKIPAYSGNNGAFSVLRKEKGNYDDNLKGFIKMIQEAENLLTLGNLGNEAVDKVAPWKLKNLKEIRLKLDSKNYEENIEKIEEIIRDRIYTSKPADEITLKEVMSNLHIMKNDEIIIKLEEVITNAEEAIQDALYLLSLLIYHIFDRLQSIMPESANKGLAIFNNKEPKSGDQINKPEPIFTRI
jgi:methionyl-tRNA synthetase